MACNTDSGGGKVKVEINNIEKGYVTSATVESNKLSTQLTINTRDRWVNHTRETHYKNTIEYHYTNEKDELLAKVTIIAKTKEDIERLTWLQFEQQNKDQLWIMFLHDEVVNCKCSSTLK